MRSSIAGLLVLSSLCANAQPGPLDRPLRLIVELDHALLRNGTGQYLLITPDQDTLTADALHTPAGDSAVTFIMVSSSAHIPWTIKYLPGGAMMDLHLDHDPSPFGFTLRLPFTQGAYELDTRRLMKCLSDQADDLRLRDARRPGRKREHPFGALDTLACHGGHVVFARGGLHAEMRIPDLMPFTKRVPRMPPTAAREASYPGGMANFQRFIGAHFSKPLIERTNARVKLSAVVTIETDGSIHRVDLNGSAYPELDREFKRVLQLSTLWEPAAGPNPQLNNDAPQFWSMEQSRVIEYTVDPDSIWTEIPDMSLTIAPAEPTSNDALSVTFHWIGGSCGKYEAYAQVQPAPQDGGPRDVFLYFGAVLSAQCEDMKPQSFGFTMKALPPGRYRFRQMPHPKLERGAWAPDPYRVRYVDVR